MSFDRDHYYTFQEVLAKYDISVSQSMELYKTLPKEELSIDPSMPGKKEIFVPKTAVEALNLSLR